MDKKTNITSWFNFLREKATEAQNNHDWTTANEYLKEAYGSIQMLLMVYPDKEKEISFFWDTWEGRYYGFDF